MAADEERAARIRALKASRPDLTWKRIAEGVGVTERSVSNWAATGEISYENAGKLAEFFTTDRDDLWAGPRESVDVMGALNGAEQPSQLDRIEEKLDGLLVIDKKIDRLIDALGLDKPKRALGISPEIVRELLELLQALPGQDDDEEARGTG